MRLEGIRHINKKRAATLIAVAVVADAFFVRVTLLPAVMKLLGDRAWWAPGRSTREPSSVVEAEGAELYA